MRFFTQKKIGKKVENKKVMYVQYTQETKEGKQIKASQ